MDKQALRQIIAARKAALSERDIDARSRILAGRLFQSEFYRSARALYAYMAFNQEVRTEPIIRQAWADGKRVAVPKVAGRLMRFIWIEDFSRLAPQGAFGIPEPLDDGPEADDPTALILVPGLAFDASGHRVGYGGGFYDRFLAAEPGHSTAALCYDFQFLPLLDVETHDMPVNLVITDA